MLTASTSKTAIYLYGDSTMEHIYKRLKAHPNVHYYNGKGAFPDQLTRFTDFLDTLVPYSTVVFNEAGLWQVAYVQTNAGFPSCMCSRTLID